MRVRVYGLISAVLVWVAPLAHAQHSQHSSSSQDPINTPIPLASRPASPDLSSSTSTVMLTNSMEVLDDKKKLGSNDYVSLRVVEDRDNESQRLRVNDNGELEVPYIGPVPAAGKTCKQLARDVKAALEKEYYYHATVILALDRVSEKSRGRVFVYGSVRAQGPQEIPADESY